jgi:nucleoside-diphosphate-sugar epimerase
MRILVTGVTGLVGNLVARRLIANQHQVRALVRDNKKLTQAREDYGEAVLGDLTNPASLSHAVKDMDVVIHCAGLVGTGRGNKDMYTRLNVNGTRSLVEAARAANVKRFVYISTVGVYGTNTFKPDVTEETPYSPSTDYPNSKIEAEKVVRAGGVPFTILRPYWITGGGDRFLIPQVARLLLNNTFTFIGNGQQEWSLSAAENVASAIVLAAVHPAAENQIYNVADGKVQIAETVRVIAEALGIPMPTQRSSVLSVTFRSLLNQAESNPSRISVDLFFPLWRGLTINADKIRRELGWAPVIPWQESVKVGTLEWKRAQKM